MGKTRDLFENTCKHSSISRRTFLKGAVAAGSAATLYGCSKNTDGEYLIVGGGTSDSSPETPRVESTFIYGSSTHNCGGKCASRAEVVNGRIVRFLSEEAATAGDGTYLDGESRNLPQNRPCARCRSYKYRIYHPGRLKYPMKQTKKRGALDGFQRISWEQAYNEIAIKHKAVYDEYGMDGIYVLYASAANHGIQGRDTLDAAYKYMHGVYKEYFGSYSTHQNTYFGTGYTGMNQNLSANYIAKYTKTLVLWGDNSMTTRNNNTYACVKIAEDMKKRDPNSKIIYIGPELSDGGVILSDQWIVSKPFTDPALVAGMIYHMLDNTFDLSNGNLKSNAWLDVDYLDTMVYGFFDSPEYGLTDASGEIDATAAKTGDRIIAGVGAGRSYCSWILGNNANAKTYDELGKTTNYTAMKYAADSNMKRWAPCSYEVTKGTQTVYKTKQDYKTPKTPAWASQITGVPEDVIIKLAETFAKPENAPVASVWSGGQQKQADGIANLFALQALQIVTKNVSEYGAGYGNTYGPSVQVPVKGVGVNAINLSPVFNRTFPTQPEKPIASCTAWHTTIKAVFADELIRNGYRAKYIPNWNAANKGTLKTGDGDIYWDDAGSKAAAVVWKRNPDTGKVETYSDGTNTYYDWEGRTGVDGTPQAHEGTPKYAGIRLMYNNAGNIFINQHENSNDSREMLECLELNKYDDPHSFCLVTFDNFLSPTTRWSDYVLPTSTSWEHPSFITPSHAASFYVPMVTPPPGESKPSWNIGIELLKAYENVDSSISGAHVDFAGGTADRSVESLARESFNQLSVDASSPFYGKTWDEYMKNPYLSAKADDSKIATPGSYKTKQNYKALSAADKLNPFIKSVANYNITTNTHMQGGYGAQFADVSTAPKPSLRYQVFSPVLTWQYENRFSKWHGYLPASKRGQSHRDIEGDRLVIEIPVYYAYQDYFMEAYGNDPAKLNDLKFLLTTTHDRYRSHSSMAENPMLRELNHRVPGRDVKGNAKPCNDFGDYSMGPDQAFEVNNKAGVIPPLERAINENGTVDAAKKDIASYSEIWINETDGLELLNIKDGDLVQVENPVGAVRCVAKLSKRCARGFVGLHQGCWYDPRPIANSYNHDFVDVGGNANTLMASQPSRIDHGNGQQSAMVKIIKVENY